MKKESIGLIGFGAVGRDIYNKISKNFINGYKIAGIFSKDINESKIQRSLKCSSLAQLLKKKTKLNC